MGIGLIMRKNGQPMTEADFKRSCDLNAKDHKKKAAKEQQAPHAKDKTQE